MSELDAEASRRAREYIELRSSLYFVLRHSGRSGTRWRVVFQSRDRAEAERVYLRKAYPRRSAPITYAATRLLQGGTSEWRDTVLARCGDPPLDGSVPIHVDGEEKAAREREERERRAETRATRRGRRRIEAPSEPVPAGVMSYEDFGKAHPAERRVENGEVFFVHHLSPGEGFTSARGALGRAYGIFVAQLRVEPPAAPLLRIGAVQDDGEALAEQEAATEEQATPGAPPLRAG